MKPWSSTHAIWLHPGNIAVAIVCLALTTVLAAGLWSSSRNRRQLKLDETGGLSEELVLGFPFFVLFLAVTIQLVLMVHAKVTVNYAAYVTARSASVWIPACSSGEQPNTIQLSSQARAGSSRRISASQVNTAKLDRIRSAAVLACAPISPSYFSWLSTYARRAEVAGFPLPDSIQGMTGPYQNALSRVDSIFTGDGSLGSATRLIPRWYYSSMFTDVSFAGAEKANNISFAANGDIQVTVEHKFYLQVPYVGWILGQKYSTLLDSATGGLFSSDTYYVPITETYTIRNEGERLYPGYCGG
ncbi:MAG TPA: TadE family protein [Candidatus Angelobacter sp.]|jgi:hypothetical protein|nr:TadE family protein [Candidatus Angelobacter sp.]